MIDMEWFKIATDDEKLELLKTYEGRKFPYLSNDKVKYNINIIDVVSLDSIVIKFVNPNDSFVEFINVHELIYYLKKSNNYMKGEYNERKTS